MRICWDNLEKLKMTRRGNLKNYNNGAVYYIADACLMCGEPFLTRTIYKGLYCSHKCSPKTHTRETIKLLQEMKTGTKVSEETKRKMSKIKQGRKFTPEHRDNLSESHRNNPRVGKGRYYNRNIPMYDTYVHQLEPIEQCRCSPNDSNILQVKCTYCDKWYTPKLTNVLQRIQFIKGNDRYPSESRFYCSKNCKTACPIFGMSADQLIKRDRIAAGAISHNKLGREVQIELRKMVLERDAHTCQKCGSKEPLHCHHIDPVAHNPIESADMDSCITFCVECHKEAHKLPGCGYGELRGCK